jgi:hypothetical protein
MNMMKRVGVVVEVEAEVVAVARKKYKKQFKQLRMLSSRKSK